MTTGTPNKLFLLALLLFTAVCLGATFSAAAPAPTGTLRIGMGAIATDLDPHMQVQAYARTTYSAIFDALTQMDVRGQVQPALATSWKQKGDLRWQFKLREGVSFHNGEKFDAESVKFTIDRIVNPASKARTRSWISLVKGAEVVDDYTVDIFTTQPDPILPQRLAVIYIVPAKYMAQVGADAFSAKPIGSGPFRVKAWAKDEYTTLEAVATAWRAIPKVAQVNLLMMPEEAARIAALKAGDIDIVQGVPPDQAEALKKDGFSIISGKVGRMIVVNLRSAIDGPLKSRQVRQALNYAVDKQAIVNHLMKGYAERAKGQIVGSDGFGYNAKILEYPYDPAKAKQLLSEAGYSNGFTLKMNGTQGAFQYDKETIEAVMSYLGKVGVKVELRINEPAIHSKLAWDGTHAPAWFHAWNYFPAMDADFALFWFESTHPVKIHASNEFDRLFRESRVMLDREKRRAKLQQIMEVLREDPPAIYLFQPHEVFAASPKVQGLATRSDMIIWLDAIAVR